MSLLDEVIVRPLLRLGQRVVESAPDILQAGLVLVIGYLIAGLLRRVSMRVLRVIGTDVIFRRLSQNSGLLKSTVGPSYIGGFVVYWTIMLSAILYALQTLGLREAAILLERLVSYIPAMFVAIGIIVIGLYAADFFGRIVTMTATSAKLPLPRWWGLGVQYATIGFTVLAVLDYLDIATTSLLFIVGIVVSIVPVAAMIAFGLGGKRQADEFIQGKLLKNEISPGDVILFSYDEHELQGTVERLSPTVLRIRSEERIYLIPYTQLTDRGVVVVSSGQKYQEG